MVWALLYRPSVVEAVNCEDYYNLLRFDAVQSGKVQFRMVLYPEDGGTTLLRKVIYSYQRKHTVSLPRIP
jgi:hypothetical protein